MDRNQISVYWWIDYYGNQMELIADRYEYRRSVDPKNNDQYLQDANEKMYKAISGRNIMRSIAAKSEQEENEDY